MAYILALNQQNYFLPTVETVGVQLFGYRRVIYVSYCINLNNGFILLKSIIYKIYFTYFRDEILINID